MDAVIWYKVIKSGTPLLYDLENHVLKLKYETFTYSKMFKDFFKSPMVGLSLMFIVEIACIEL